MNLLINAGPGCGKTHSLVDSYLYYKTSNPDTWRTRFRSTDEQQAIYEWVRKNHPPGKKAIYMAYNTPINEELKKKIHPDCESRTCHGWGYKVLNNKFGYIPINYKRDQLLVEKITGQSFGSLPNKNTWYKSIKYMEKIKEELLPIESSTLYYLNQKYGDLVNLQPAPEMIEQLHQLKAAMRTVDRKIGITYIDQIWLAIGLLTHPLYDIGYVDECQDLSPARLALATRLCKNLVFCGDPNQAINAFSGADPEAFSRIRETCELELPLKLSFRLPPNHAERANALRPTANIRSLPEKAPGGFNQISLAELPATIEPLVQRKPVILCRYNAPLIKATIQLLRAGIPCRALGDTLVNQLIGQFKALRAHSIANMVEKLTSSKEKYAILGSPAAQDQNMDRIDCLLYIAEACQSLSEVEPLLKEMLKAKENHVLLSTVHKAKGLETKELFLLFPPMTSNRGGEQEPNVEFVAYTRSSNNITEIYP
jgi:DNA helicase-2/ATP-dependent DNA helicase PcrA